MRQKSAGSHSNTAAAKGLMSTVRETTAFGMFVMSSSQKPYFGFWLNDITNVQVPAPPISVGDVANSVDMRVAWIPRKHE